MNERQGHMRPKSGVDPTFPRLLGDRLCLDFANTIEAPLHAPEDFLGSYADLVRWGRHTALLSDREAEGLLGEADRGPAEAAETFAVAIALRGAIQQVFGAIATGATPEPRDLAIVEQAYVTGLTRAHLTPSEGAFAWAWGDGSGADRLERLLWPIARSAVDLLINGEPARMKQCAGPDGCGWLFYDTSKNGSRRWCSMEGCGSRAKMRRYNSRRKLARG